MRRFTPYKLHSIESGSGPPLLLIHGLFDSLETWQRLIPLLSGRFKIYAIDLPAFGRSVLPPSWKESVSEMIKAVIAFLDEKGITTVSLVGSSMGGGLALGIAGHTPERVNRIALMNPYGLPKLPMAAMASRRFSAGRLLPYLLGQSALRRCAKGIFARSIYSRTLITEPLIDRVVRPFSSLQQRKNLFRFLKGISLEEIQSIDAHLPMIRHPVLILWGEKDGWLSDAHWERLRDRLKNGKVVKIPDCGHLPHMEKPEVVAKATIPFLTAAD
ncbi:MAG: alpha/beta fold hydrolase [Nitrospiria bacterium]